MNKILDDYKGLITLITEKNKAIEEKKMRKARELKEQLELDLKEELKVKKALEEEQRLLNMKKTQDKLFANKNNCRTFAV